MLCGCSSWRPTVFKLYPGIGQPLVINGWYKSHFNGCFSSHSVAPIFDGHRGGKFTTWGVQSCRTTSFLTQGRALLEYEFLGGKKNGFEQLFVCSHGVHMGTYGYMVYHTLPQKYFMFIGKWCSIVNQDLGYPIFRQTPKSWLRGLATPHINGSFVTIDFPTALWESEPWITQGITRTTWMIFPCDRCSWPVDGPAKSMISHQLKTMGSTSHDFGWLLTPITIWFIGDIWWYIYSFSGGYKPIFCFKDPKNWWFFSDFAGEQKKGHQHWILSQLRMPMAEMIRDFFAEARQFF